MKVIFIILKDKLNTSVALEPPATPMKGLSTMVPSTPVSAIKQHDIAKLKDENSTLKTKVILFLQRPESLKALTSLQLKSEVSKAQALEKTLESNQKEMEKFNTKIQNLESKISKEMHEKTSLQADKASLMTELKDEQVKNTTLSQKVCFSSPLFALTLSSWIKQARSLVK